MATPDKKRILVAESEILEQATLVGLLKDSYHVVVAKSTAALFKRLEEHTIDMVLLAVRFAEEDGFAICHQLQKNPDTAAIPVIFISKTNSIASEMKAFEVGAVDYILKPFNAPTALARIRSQLQLSDAIRELKRLNQLALDANPNTGLPGNNSILKELRRVIAFKEKVAVIYADLDNFKAYNDTYGFAKGDEVIVFAANVIRSALISNHCSDAFIGHIGGDDFVFVVASDKCRAVTADIIERIERGIGEFYTEEDMQRGSVTAKNRAGQSVKHPLVCLSMGGIDLGRRQIDSVFAIIDICTETKNQAKKQDGSNILLCKRQG